jgi:hypothetical protein
MRRERAVPEAWLYNPTASGELLVAYVPPGDESEWRTIPAYRPGGESVDLDPIVPPIQPVLVVKNRGRLALRAALDDINRALAEAGLQQAVQPRKGRHMTTRLDSIRVANDHESWIMGDAEMYAIVSGVLEDNAPQLRAVELPYLKNEGITYMPEQIVLDWRDYKFRAANLQIFEQDDDTNYQAMVTAFVDAVGAVGSLAGYPELQAVTEIADRIIKLMPSDWFANSDDYVDSFYTIEMDRPYTDRIGAAQNATVILMPYELVENP